MEEKVMESGKVYCRSCGKEIPANANACPECGTETEVWSRVVGYLRPVQNYHKGKREEYRQRVKYRIKENELEAGQA